MPLSTLCANCDKLICQCIFVPCDTKCNNLHQLCTVCYFPKNSCIQCTCEHSYNPYCSNNNCCKFAKIMNEFYCGEKCNLCNTPHINCNNCDKPIRSCYICQCIPIICTNNCTHKLFINKM